MVVLTTPNDWRRVRCVLGWMADCGFDSRRGVWFSIGSKRIDFVFSKPTNEQLLLGIARDILEPGVGNLIAPLLEQLADKLGERHDIRRPGEGPYLTRWVLQGKRDEGNDGAVYLHRFHRSDADEMHDHPWPYTSLIIAGGYFERSPAPGWSDGCGSVVTRWYAPGSVLVRPAKWIHSIVIPDGCDCWSLVFRGPKERSWGFWCPGVGFRPWRDHAAKLEATGCGCS